MQISPLSGRTLCGILFTSGLSLRRPSRNVYRPSRTGGISANVPPTIGETRGAKTKTRILTREGNSAAYLFLEIYVAPRCQKGYLEERRRLFSTRNPIAGIPINRPDGLVPSGVRSIAPSPPPMPIFTRRIFDLHSAAPSRARQCNSYMFIDSFYRRRA